MRKTKLEWLRPVEAERGRCAALWNTLYVLVFLRALMRPLR